MVVGVARVELYFPDPNSLKAKRQILRALMQRIEANFKRVSIAEVDGHDLWQKIVLGISVVGKDKPFVDSRLTTLLDFIQKESTLEMLKADVEYLDY
jgi:uncharacterized protein YlxP (DUF503 family)